MEKDSLGKMANLQRKILFRLNSEIVEGDENTTSIAELYDSLHDELEIFNDMFIKKESQNVRTINLSSGYTKFTPSSMNKTVPKVSKIIPTVGMDGSKGIWLFFSNANGEDLGYIVLSENYMQENFNQLDKTIKSNSEIFDKMFSLLDFFIEEFPGFNYVWDKDQENTYNQVVGDNFISCNIDTNNLKNITVTLTKKSDLEIANIKSKEYGELFDYINTYQQLLMEKTPIQVDSLNPFLKAVLNKSRNVNMDDLFSL